MAVDELLALAERNDEEPGLCIIDGPQDPLRFSLDLFEAVERPSFYLLQTFYLRRRKEAREGRRPIEKGLAELYRQGCIGFVGRLRELGLPLEPLADDTVVILNEEAAQAAASGAKAQEEQDAQAAKAEEESEREGGWE